MEIMAEEKKQQLNWWREKQRDTLLMDYKGQPMNRTIPVHCLMLSCNILVNRSMNWNKLRYLIAEIVTVSPLILFALAFA